MSDELVYNHPKYYDLAFSFRHIPFEADVFEECIRRYAKRPCRRMLEIGCGNSPHMLELLARGYEYVGIDLNPTMLAYSRAKAGDRPVTLLEADMTEFALDAPVDFAFVMLGSVYVSSYEEWERHFDCVGGALSPGGLYFLDWVVDFDPITDHAETWDVEEDGVRVRTSCLNRCINRVEQLVSEDIYIEVDDHGEQFMLTQSTVKRVVYPQEFLQFIRQRADFEFVGWWNHWDLDMPLDGVTHTTRPITLVRRTE